MQAALEELVDAATVRLRELSSGQFSLELVEREFMVRDHANADELRSARTLSGGETFLASLSLALALADATSELSPEGAPTIESIFLDEGFGSLDPGTLDVVAAAIEELGSTGRMVAVVTHIRELADRMPVRLEVDQGRRRRRPSSGSRPDALQRRDVGAGVRVVDRGRGPRRRVRARRRHGRAAARPTGRRSSRRRAERPERILFVDGVRRVDARVWIHDGDRAHAGVCASVAAGVVECAGSTAAVTEWRVERALIAPAAAAGRPASSTRHARLRARADRRRRPARRQPRHPRPR